MKPSNVGGQAVLEGVMMRSGDQYAVAVRKKNGEIEIKKETYKGIFKWDKLKTIPFVRGIFNFIDSMVLGYKSLNFSASFYEDEEEEVVKEGKKCGSKKSSEKMDQLIMILITILSFVFAIGIFTMLPYFIIQFVERWVQSHVLLSVIEGFLRIFIFVAYIWVVSKMEDIRRTYMYHGAEHKCINCIENGLELTVENVRNSSKEHKRCGTSFIFFVVLISIVFLFFIQTDTVWLKIASRIALLPVIAGISYELIKLAGRSNNPIVTILSKPGMWMQELTTKEPDDDMIEVAIASVEAVFDWKSFIKRS